MPCSKSIYFFLLLLPLFATAQKTTGSIEWYGHILTDVGYNFNAIDPNWFDVMRPSKLPSYEGQYGPSGNFFTGVRQTKMGIKTHTQTSLGLLKTQFDFDLVGFGKDVGQTTMHVVNAYAQLGKIGAGQTASAFMDLDVFPATLDYWGPLSRVFFLNIQLRYVAIEEEHEKLIVALERPGATADGGDYTNSIELQNVVPRFPLPNLTAQYRKGGKWGYVQFAGILKSMHWKDIDTTGFDLSGSAVGWGLNVGTVLHASKSIKLKLQGVLGEGIENYIADVTPDVGLKSQPQHVNQPVVGVALPVFGYFAFTEIKWNQVFQSSIGYSMLAIDNADLQSPRSFRSGQYGLINLRYFPASNMMFGIEYQYGRRNNFTDDFYATGHKIQCSVKLSFSNKQQ